MKLTTLVRLAKDGVTCESYQTGEVSEGYSDEQFAARTIKQLRAVKQDLTAGLTAKRVAKELRKLPLFETSAN